MFGRSIGLSHEHTIHLATRNQCGQLPGFNSGTFPPSPFLQTMMSQSSTEPSPIMMPSREQCSSFSPTFYYSLSSSLLQRPFLNVHGLKMVNGVTIPFLMTNVNLACIFATFMVCMEPTRNPLYASGRVAIRTCKEALSGGTSLAAT